MLVKSICSGREGEAAVEGGLACQQEAPHIGSVGVNRFGSCQAADIVCRHERCAEVANRDDR